MDAYEILVIVLSVMLALLLAVSVVFVVVLVKILNQIKRITDKADDVIDKVSSVGDFFQKTSGPLAVGRYVAEFIRTVKGRKSNHKGRR